MIDPKLAKSEKLRQLKHTCRGCGELVDRTEILDLLNGVSNPDLEPLVIYSEDEIYHNEKCMNWAFYNDYLDDVELMNPDIDWDWLNCIHGCEWRRKWKRRR
jgi:hypothetical protein